MNSTGEKRKKKTSFSSDSAIEAGHFFVPQSSSHGQEAHTSISRLTNEHKLFFPLLSVRLGTFFLFLFLKCCLDLLCTTNISHHRAAVCPEAMGARLLSCHGDLSGMWRCNTQRHPHTSKQYVFFFFFLEA